MATEIEILTIISVALFHYGLLSTLYFKWKIKGIEDRHAWLIDYKDRKIDDCRENYLRIIDGWKKQWDDSQIK